MAKDRHFNLIKYDDLVSKENVQMKNSQVGKKSIPPVSDTAGDYTKMQAKDQITKANQAQEYSVETKLEILRDGLDNLRKLIYDHIYPTNIAELRKEYNSVTTEQLKLAINKKKEELTFLEAKLASIKQFPVLDNPQNILSGLVNKDF